MAMAGIVRRVDDLGRVVIPKEIRKILWIGDGDSIEIVVNRDGEVILRKHSPAGRLGDFAQDYADSLYESTGHEVCIADREKVIAVAGAPAEEFLNKPLAVAVARSIMERKTVRMSRPGSHPYCAGCPRAETGRCRFTAQVIVPICTGGEPIGVMILSTQEPHGSIGELEAQIVETAAEFLAKQMKQ
ncbi:AbrB family transcriptional regulator (stage V sporulation protein T) [Hydrogenispora ethanolica]|uniref:AbrB family transcriptional regulator (Stage V sporulation protein T) n=1 Tax=Hydrogenispora ethanolica TaxID=1082276 RepID=A0A4R1RWB1_HYDET|nr:stage V sporulation T C-terminal domain-containing protein [Hydrogenispora ethanolica]TCL70983.1 AbrB family transcriptional regulator (stage V sporulation protein T) [Hydrogenispora ethanolica]